MNEQTNFAGNPNGLPIQDEKESLHYANSYVELSNCEIIAPKKYRLCSNHLLDILQKVRY